MAKNITLAIDEDLLDKARVLAAMRRTSVNEMVREFLAREVKREAQQASRAEVWGRMFEATDKNAAGHQPGKQDVLIFDRNGLYEEVMRERSLL